MWALLNLKLRLMKDNRILYVTMFAMSILFSMVLSGFSGDDYRPSVVIVDEAHSLLASEVIETLVVSEQFDLELVNLGEAEDQIKNRDAIAAIHFTEYFKPSGEGLVIIELAESAEVIQLKMVIESALENVSASEGVAETLESMTNTNEISAVNKRFSELWANKKAIEIQTGTSKFSELVNYNSGLHYILGMTLFFLTFSIMFTVGDILEDRRLKTFDRMLVAPISKKNIIIANLIPALLVGVLQLCLMILVGSGLFNVNWGIQIGYVLLIGTAYVFAMTALSLLSASIVNNMGQLSAISPLVLTGMGMIGGCMWPIEIVESKVMLKLAELTPHYWAIKSIKELIADNSMSPDIWKSIGLLLGMGITYLFIGVQVLNKKSENSMHTE